MENYKTHTMKFKNLIQIVLGKTALAAVLPLLFLSASVPAFAQLAMVQDVGVYQSTVGISGGAGDAVTKKIYCDFSKNDSAITDVSFYSAGTGGDPWKTSALIEYDKPFDSTAGVNKTVDSTATGTYKYPNHCLSLCMDVYCVNPPNAGSTYSISFPIQDIKFDIVKYYEGKNIYNPDDTPAVRSIAIYPMTSGGEYMCAGYTCAAAVGNADAQITCSSAEWACDSVNDTACKSMVKDSSATKSYADACKAPTGDPANCIVATAAGARFGSPMTFCTAWDASYEIAGEFGKTNGNFAYRATIHTSYPGDNITVDKIEVDDTKAYPGMNQIPIQVDVTNVHTVRSTPTVVGSITSVAAQPYTLAYRLSKDSDVRIGIYDASKQTPTGGFEVEELSGNTVTKWNSLRRILTDWQPRTGEGVKGQASDKLIVEFDSWDGRDKDGRLLPAGNYIASIQAKSNDEWPGTDFSRAVTRQLSLDPLKLTDITSAGLNKQSTAYATVQYVPTESATVYLNVYTPGTTFNVTDNGALYTQSYTPTGTAPAIANNSGTLVYSAAEQRSGRMNYTSRWDGLCGVDGGCTRTFAKGEKMPAGGTCGDASNTAVNNVCTQEFAKGAPMPDGDYVYVLWAEIPYNTPYCNAASGLNADGSGAGCTWAACTKDGCYTAVKTQRYETGNLSLERGLVDITIQPVSYSTVGSSPTAYGLDPFLFKYTIARDATVIARVENSAGVLVKSLTPAEGTSNVAQQMNTLQWDGRDDQGRMVSPGTYMFTVTTKDAMFPAVTNKASAIFPVDLYRVVDVATTDVYGDSEAKATISYYLSKAMNVQINIYNKDVVIPNYNTTTGEYPGLKVTVSGTPVITYSNTGAVGTTVTYTPTGTADEFTRVTVKTELNPDPVTNPGTYQITTTTDTVVSQTSKAAWPPRVCDLTTDAAVFTSGYVDPAKVATQGATNACIYVNDKTFTHYPANATAAADVKGLDVRLQPVKTFDRSSTRPGEGLRITEEWDALYFYNPSSAQCQGQTDLTQCKYEMVPDGQYPFYIAARSNEAVTQYYAAADEKDAGGKLIYIASAPYTKMGDVKQADFIYATEKPVSRINVTRGPVYFLEGSTVVYPNAPQLFNASSGPVFIPPYEINFAVSRASTVEVAIVALGANVCNPVSSVTGDNKNNRPGDVCKYLSTTTILNTSDFDPNVTRKVYWDGTDNNGYYVKPGIYEVRLIAKNYPDPGLYQETVKSITINADLMKVFDLLEADGYSLSQRNTDVKIGYQISVPMKVAIQIFKPGTTIFDYQKGTLRNPATGQEVKDINEVLVRTIVGIRPATTLIEEAWDGRDYAQQEVPDGTYPFRFVTAVNSADIDTITGEITRGDDASTDSADWKVNYVADTIQYQQLHKITVAIGDGRFVCEDWEKTVFFYPNPFRAANGTLEITKMPVPGTMSIKLYTLDGTMIRNGGYTCVDANNYVTTIGDSFEFSPDNNISGTTIGDANITDFPSVRNAALRCRWDKTNQHGKKVARGVYFGLVDFKAQNGREHCQKVVKILIP